MQIFDAGAIQTSKRLHLHNVDYSGSHSRDELGAQREVGANVTGNLPGRSSALTNSRLNALAGLLCLSTGILLSVLSALLIVSGSRVAVVFAVCLLLAASLVIRVYVKGTARARIRVAAMSFSFLLTIAVCEICLRAFTVYPINASSNVVADSELGYRLDPALPDVDDNGFRNPSVLAHAQLVTIGDSHTQGYNVAAEDSWPSQLGRRLHKSVYNFGVGGYGPLHYQQLIPRALALNPDVVVVGVYLANDLADVARGIHPRLAEPVYSQNVIRLFRYRTAVGSLLFQILRNYRLDQIDGIVVEHPRSPTQIDRRIIKEFATNFDLNRAEISGALQTTIEILKDAHEKCEQRNSKLVVLLIPSRERGYRQTIDAHSQNVPPEYFAMIDQEIRVTESFAHSLSEAGILTANAEDFLVRQLEQSESVYPNWSDGHPLTNGYTAYADAVYAALESVVPRQQDRSSETR